MVAVLHLLLLAVVLFVLRRLQLYISAKFAGAAVHCPTQLAADGQYEAPPRGWIVVVLIIRLIIPRLILLVAIIGFYLILIFDFDLRTTISTWFNKPGWEWKLPMALAIGVFINLIATLGRLRSRRSG